VKTNDYFAEVLEGASRPRARVARRSAERGPEAPLELPGRHAAALRDEAENQSLDDRRVLAALPPVPAAEAPDGLEALKPVAARAARLLAEADGRPKSRSTHARANADGGLATLRSWGGQEVLTLAPDEAPAALRDEAPALRAAHKAMLLHHRALLALVDDNDFALSFLDAEEAPTADQDEAGES